MVRLNIYDPKEKLNTFLEYLNEEYISKYESIDKYSTTNGKFLFSNDPIYKFITQIHFAKKQDFDPNARPVSKLIKKDKENKRVYDNRLICPALLDSYMKFEQHNYAKQKENESPKYYDPFYLMWIEQIETYYAELRKLTELYFMNFDSNTYYNANCKSPIEYYIYFNEKIVRLRRLSTLIMTLVENNPSIFTPNQTENYSYVRCNMIDDAGDILRNKLIKIDEVGQIQNPEKENYKKESSKKNVKFHIHTGIIADGFKPELFSKKLFEIIGKFEKNGHELTKDFLTTYSVNTKNNEMVELDFSSEKLTLPRILSILEFAELYKELHG